MKVSHLSMIFLFFLDTCISHGTSRALVEADNENDIASSDHHEEADPAPTLPPEDGGSGDQPLSYHELKAFIDLYLSDKSIDFDLIDASTNDEIDRFIYSFENVDDVDLVDSSSGDLDPLDYTSDDLDKVNSSSGNLDSLYYSFEIVTLVDSSSKDLDPYDYSSKDHDDIALVDSSSKDLDPYDYSSKDLDDIALVDSSSKDLDPYEYSSKDLDPYDYSSEHLDDLAEYFSEDLVLVDHSSEYLDPLDAPTDPVTTPQAPSAHESSTRDTPDSLRAGHTPSDHLIHLERRQVLSVMEHQNLLQKLHNGVEKIRSGITPVILLHFVVLFVFLALMYTVYRMMLRQ